MKNKKVIIPIFIIIGIIIIAVLEINEKKSNNKNLNNNPALLYFQSSLGRLTFEYPAAFGSANEKIKTIANSSGSVMAGKAASITFSNNLNVYINRASTDYRPFLDDFYSGEKDFDELCRTDAIDEYGNGCKIRNIGPHKVLEQTEYIVTEGTYNLLHFYSIKLTDNDGYSGIKIMQSISSIYDRLNSNLPSAEIKNICQTEATAILNKSNNGYNQSIYEIEALIASLKI